uniref:Uncharacterized protein n=1 Tax=Rhizophora mucronata TaxID=61149 RepID=A0A2P2P155_RHIMU
MNVADHHLWFVKARYCDSVSLVGVFFPIICQTLVHFRLRVEYEQGCGIGEIVVCMMALRIS